MLVCESLCIQVGGQLYKVAMERGDDQPSGEFNEEGRYKRVPIFSNDSIALGSLTNMTINEDDPLMHIYQDMFNETTDIDQSDPILNTREVYRALQGRLVRPHGDGQQDFQSTKGAVSINVRFT